MDINAILPLLLGKTDMKDKTKLFTALASGGSPEDVLAGALPPEASGLLSLFKNRSASHSRPPVLGLKAIASFAPPDIFGSMFKLLA